MRSKKSDPVLQSTASSESDRPASLRRRIVVVDDHPVTRQGVSALIDQQPDLIVCGQSDTAAVALQMIERMKPDLAIIDITLRTTSGIELLKDLKALMPTLPILIMSMHDESLYAERALRAGARGYIMKLETGESVVDAVRTVLNGEMYLSAVMKERILHSLVRNRKENVEFTIDTLSDRELEVFLLLGNGFSTRHIAEKLNLSVKTIDSYREHLKVKLRLENAGDLVRHAIQWVRSEGVV